MTSRAHAWLLATLLFLVGVLVGQALERSWRTETPARPPSSWPHDPASWNVKTLSPAVAAPELWPLCEAVAAESAEPREQALLAAAWIYGSVDVRDSTQPISGDPVVVLRSLSGACGARDRLLEAVLGCLGIPARRVNFFGVPVQVGHSTTEAWFDGDWHLIDSALGLYFGAVTDPSRILSIHEARAVYPDLVVMRMTVEPWQGRPLDVAELGRTARELALFEPFVGRVLWRPHVAGTIMADLEQTYFASKLTNGWPDQHFSWPTLIDLAQAPHGSFGQIDGVGEPLVQPFHAVSYGRLYQPFMATLGRHDPSHGPIVDRVFQFLTDVPRTVTLTFRFTAAVPSEVQRHLLTQIDHADMDYDAVDTAAEVTWQPQTLSVDALVLPPASTVTLRLNDTLIRHTPLRMKSIEWRAESARHAR